MPNSSAPHTSAGSVRIVVDDMFDGTPEQFEDCFGGEPAGLTLAGFIDFAARNAQPIRIEIAPAAH